MGKFSPSKMWQVANHCQAPPIKLSIEAIQDKILTQQGQGVTDVEFFWLVTSERPWQSLAPISRHQLSLAIWKIAMKNHWLFKNLAYRLILAEESDQKRLTNDLISHWSEFQATCPEVDEDQHFFYAVLCAVTSNNHYYGLLKLTYEYQLVRSQLWAKIEHTFPQVRIFQEYITGLTNFFCLLPKISNKDIQWFLDCLDDLNQDLETPLVDSLLQQCSVEFFESKPKLLDWLVQKYYYSENKFVLSAQAITKLQQLVGAVNYQIFDQIVQAVLNKIQLEDHEIRQLKSRRNFWKNYTDSFITVRVLLPYKSYNLFSFNQPYNIDILDEDGSEEAEVCIFDIAGKEIMVEVFRGEGSDLRIFPATEKYRKILFQHKNLSIQKIRVLGGDRHDHKTVWQYFLEKRLREVSKILPNSNISYFHGLSREHGRYSQLLGLPRPVQEKLDKRKKQLKYWERNIENLEKKARLKYPNFPD